MDISSNQPLRATSAVNGVSASHAGSGEVGAALNTKSTSLVSSAAKDLSSLAKLAREAPDVRQDKVDQLKAKIESGQYKVDLNKLADHLNGIL